MGGCSSTWYINVTILTFLRFFFASKKAWDCKPVIRWTSSALLLFRSDFLRYTTLKTNFDTEVCYDVRTFFSLFIHEHFFLKNPLANLYFPRKSLGRVSKPNLKTSNKWKVINVPHLWQFELRNLDGSFYGRCEFQNLRIGVKKGKNGTTIFLRAISKKRASKKRKRRKSWRFLSGEGFAIPWFSYVNVWLFFLSYCGLPMDDYALGKEKPWAKIVNFIGEGNNTSKIFHCTPHPNINVDCWKFLLNNVHSSFPSNWQWTTSTKNHASGKEKWDSFTCSILWSKFFCKNGVLIGHWFCFFLWKNIELGKLDLSSEEWGDCLLLNVLQN